MPQNTRIGSEMSANMLEAFCAALGMAMFVYDKDDNLIFVSRDFTDYFPVPKESMAPGCRLRDLLAAVYDCGIRFQYNNDTSRTNARREEWIAERIAFHWRERYESIEKIKRDRWFRLVKKRLPNGTGLSFVFDVSEQKKREENWKADLQRVKLTEDILDNLPSPLCVKDRNLSYVAVNKAFCDMHGLAEGQFLGNSVWDVLEADIAEQIEISDRKVLDTGEPSETAEQITNATGAELRVLTRKYRVGVPGRYYLVTTMLDVSRIASVADVAGPERDELQFARRQDCTMPDIPLPRPRVQSTVMMTVQDDANQPEARLLVIGRDVVKTGGLALTLSVAGYDVSCMETMVDAELFLTYAREMDLDVDLILLADSDFREGLKLAARQGVMALVVEANLTGNELIPMVQEGLQARDQQQIIGSFRLSEAPATHPVAAVSHQQSQLDVLVVEDNPLNQNVYAHVLDSLKLTFRIVDTREQALDFYNARRPRVMFLDIDPTDQTGFDICRSVQQAEATAASRTPVIGVLTQSDSGLAAKCASAGFADTITKPLSPESIKDSFDKVLGLEARRDAA